MRKNTRGVRVRNIGQAFANVPLKRASIARLIERNRRLERRAKRTDLVKVLVDLTGRHDSQPRFIGTLLKGRRDR